MPDTPAYEIDGPGARRVDRTVRIVLGPGNRTSGSPPADRGQVETVWARLTNKVDAGWEWVEIGRQDNGADPPTWVTIEEGRKGDNGRDDPEKNLAVELAATEADETASAGDVTLLRRTNTRVPSQWAGEPDTWIPGWAIVPGLPPGGLQYHVLQRPDDTGTGAIWGPVRFVNDPP